jgi:hypothetical protein
MTKEQKAHYTRVETPLSARMQENDKNILNNTSKWGENSPQELGR